MTLVIREPTVYINLYRTVVMVMSLISDGETEVVKDKKGLNVRIVFVSATLLVLLEPVGEEA